MNDHEQQAPGHARTRWRTGSVALAIALLAVACTGNGGGTGRAPATPSPPPGSPAATRGSGPASPPPANGLRGLITFSTRSGDIWVMHADGSNRRRVTSAGGNDFDPSFSPDGRRVVYRTSRGHFAPDPQRDGSFDVFVMGADGSGQTRLTRSADQESPVAWPPDGRIVYASFHGDQPLPHWYLMDAHGAGVRGLPQLQEASDPIDWLVTAG